MNAYALTWLQTRFELRTFLRNRTAVLFTAVFPILFLIVFGQMNSGTTEFRGAEVESIRFFVPGILAFGVISACYTNLAIRTVMLRDNGVMKRVKGTPLPRASYIGGLIMSSAALGVVMAVVTYVIALIVYGVSIDVKHLPAALIALVFGSACFCAIAQAVASAIPNGDGAPGIVNFLLFPVLFISDVFYSAAALPSWLSSIAEVFPVKHFANAMQTAFTASPNAWGVSGIDLLVMLAWTIVATVIAVKNFKWEPRRAG